MAARSNPQDAAPGTSAADSAASAASAASADDRAGSAIPVSPASPATPAVRPQDLADEAIALVRRWLDEAAKEPVNAAAARLAGVLRDPNGLAFTVGFVDGVVRPEDLRAAARNLRALTPLTPKFLAAPLRAAIGLGGAVGPLLPGVVVPAARRVLRQMVQHLIIDATDSKLGPAIARIKREGVRLNMNLLGEYILGEGEAARRLAGTEQLLARNDVEYVSIKVSSTVAPHNHWAFDEAVNHIEEHLLGLYQLAANASPAKFINLDMEEYKDLDLTIAVFTRILDRPEFKNLEAGIVLQAYLPDALGAMMRLQQWAAARVAAGGAPIKVRVVKGANLPMEHVDAAIHGWPQATWPTKQNSDTSYKAVLDYALRPDHVRNVRVGVAGHNLFDVALAWLLAKARGAQDGVEFEMLLGMATGQAEVVRREVGSLLLYTPVVHPAEFDVAIAYLIRRLEEGASRENFMSAVFEMGEDQALFERERDRFLASLADLAAITADGDPAHFAVPAPNRTQDRRVTSAEGATQAAEQDAAVEADREARVAARTEAGVAGFTNTPDSDPDLPGNREWGRAIAERMVNSTLGRDLVGAARLATRAELDIVLDRGVAAAASWRELGADRRAAILNRAGELLEARRGQLLEVMGAEAGKTLDQGDPEVSEAIDFAHYYAGLGQALDAVEGAQFTPAKLVAVIPPWNFPLAIPAGGTLAALAAGAAVVVKPASAAARSGAVMVQALWDAGVPRDVLQLVQFGDRALASELVADARVERVILTGSYETAVTMREVRPDLPILAETSGKNAIIVTPNADLDLAVRDVVQSAFGHAGQKCSAASLVVLVGSVAKSQRFRRQLLDAVRSLKVGTPDSLETQMGPVIAPPSGKLLRGLTTLGAGESWLIEPAPVEDGGALSRDEAGAVKLWKPGVRDGVQPGSEYHLTEYFGPILGIMTADTLAEAIELVNATDYGLTSGLHSLDRDDLEAWLDGVHAGNLYVNRGITGAIVRRQPFGGWKKSAIGPGTKAGGPSYLFALGDWQDAPVRAGAGAGVGAEGAGAGIAVGEPAPTVRELVAAAALDGADADWLREALASDARAWAAEFGAARDVSQLDIEHNVLRYRPVPVVVRITADARLRDAVRVLAAGLLAAAPLTVSTATALPAGVAELLRAHEATVVVEDADLWRGRVARLAAADGPEAGARIRLVAGADRAAALVEVTDASGGKPDIAVYGGEVVRAGRVELLPFVREQAVSITGHRFGTPSTLAEGLFD